MSACCSNHDDKIIMDRGGLPTVHVKDNGELLVGQSTYSQHRTSGDYRMLAYVHLALAEHQHAQEKAEVDELDRIAIDLFAIPWVSLDEGDRNAVQAVHDRYTRKDDTPAARQGDGQEN